MSTDVRENWSCDEEISLSSSLWIALTNTENLYLKKKKQNQRKNFLSIKSDDATCTSYQITSMNSELDRKSMFTRHRVSLAFCLIWFEIWERIDLQKATHLFWCYLSTSSLCEWLVVSLRGREREREECMGEKRMRDDSRLLCYHYTPPETYL